VTLVDLEQRRPPAAEASPPADPRRLVLDAVAAGVTLTGGDLAERCGISDRRGREVIAAVRAELVAAAAPPVATAAAAPVAAAAGPAPWPDRAITIVVGVVAAVASFGHMRHVAQLAGEPEWIAWLWPITVDGLALAALRRGEGGRRWLALGLAVSVAANVVAQYPEWAVAAGPVISAWPPLALYGTHRLLHRSATRAAPPG
jgi:hypothetical protein